jgi:4-amino-4-deoxy-L-arabinose transferase-like glycosyltransferase
MPALAVPRLTGTPSYDETMTAEGSSSRQGTSRGGRFRWAFPVAIVGAACAVAAAAGWHNSATNDEPYHTLAAFTYVHDGHGDLNVEHPPLVKLAAGAALLPLHLRGTVTPPVHRLSVLSEEVRRFLYFNTVPAETILRAARMPQLVFLALLLAGVYAWSRWAFGWPAALLATVAVACQPLVLGHAFVVHTDVASAAGWTWSFFLLHRWLVGRSAGWLPFGAVLGLALLVKFSDVYIVPLAAVAVLVTVLRTGRRAELARFAGACAVALAIVIAGMAIPLRNGDVQEERETIAATLHLWPGTAGIVDRLEEVAEVSRPLAHYALGLAYVWQTNIHGQGINFFFGRTSVEGFTWYFPAALVLKTSLPFLVLAGVGLVGTVRQRATVDLALLLVVAYYLLISLGTSYNIGARHLMPILPLLAMVGAHHAAALARPFRMGLVACMAAPALLGFPHYIAQFNVLVGGAQRGARLLNDSNLDWGQDWARLACEARQNGWAPMAYVYLGAGDPNHDMPRAVDAIAAATLPKAGYVAVSSYAATVGVPYLEAFRYRAEAARLATLLALVHSDGAPVGNVGHTITVYRLPPEGQSKMKNERDGLEESN